MNLKLEFTYAGKSRTLVKHPTVVANLKAGAITEADAIAAPWYLRATIGNTAKCSYKLVSADKKAIADAKSLLAGAVNDPDAFKAFKAAKEAKRSVTIGDLAKDWIIGGYRYSASKPRPVPAIPAIAYSTTKALRWWGDKPAASIKPKMLEEFAVWRRANTKHGMLGNRAIDKELDCLSSLCNWAVFDERIPANPFVKRATFCDDSEVNHCHEAMPESDEQMHRILTYLWADLNDTTRVLAGAVLAFCALTGLRPGEPKFLRRVPASDSFPHNLASAPLGLIYTLPDGSKKMKIKRLKKGQNPAVVITPAVADFLACYTLWLDAHFPGSEELFPVCKHAAHKRLVRACKHMGLPSMKAHGFGRAYYVRVRRSHGMNDAQIALELGQASDGELIRSTYGDPGDGVGGNLYDWLPADGPAAWEMLRAESPENVISIAARA